MLYLANRARAHSATTQRALRAADGYLYFAMAEEALAELESISADEQNDPAVLLARIRSLLHAKRWQQAESLSREAVVSYPHEDEFTVQRAFALHQLQNERKAVEVLLSAPDWIRRTGILHYNLACYEARLGDLSTARQCIDAAIQLNAAMKRNARVDPDLRGLWN
jgi:Flp pilus assembly protein TadD